MAQAGGNHAADAVEQLTGDQQQGICTKSWSHHYTPLLQQMQQQLVKVQLLGVLQSACDELDDELDGQMMHLFLITATIHSSGCQGSEECVAFHLHVLQWLP